MLTPTQELLNRVKKWREEQGRRNALAAIRPPSTELPKFRKLVEYEADGIKGWVTVPGGASSDGR